MLVFNITKRPIISATTAGRWLNNSNSVHIAVENSLDLAIVPAIYFWIAFFVFRFFHCLLFHRLNWFSLISKSSMMDPV